MAPSLNNGLYATIVQQQQSEITGLKAKLVTANQKFEEMKKQMDKTHEKEIDELNSLKSRNLFLTDRAAASSNLIVHLNKNIADMKDLKGKQET